MTERLPQVFAYDDMNRVTSADVPPGQANYTYDTAGNRLTRTLNTASDAYTYDSGVTGRLQSVTGTNATTLTYDASGRTTGLGSLTLTYNDRGRLAQVSNPGGTLGQYTYNALEQRVIKAAGGATTVFLYDRQGRLITESSSTGTILREYIYFNGEPLALVESGATYYFANDQLGSGQALLDQNGQTEAPVKGRMRHKIKESAESYPPEYSLVLARLIGPAPAGFRNDGAASIPEGQD